MKALRHSGATRASRQAVLGALARYSDANGDNAFPSVSTLMVEAKAGRATVIAALAEALERLFRQSRFQGDDDLVFTLTGDPQPKANITRRFRKALKAAGLDDSHRFHDLRHCFGTRMAATGEVPMRTLQEWMGHRDLATTQVYADYAPSVNEGQMVARAFARGTNRGTNLSESEVISDDLKPSNSRENAPT